MAVVFQFLRNWPQAPIIERLKCGQFISGFFQSYRDAMTVALQLLRNWVQPLLME
jgi:hypothetical protein